MHSNDNPTTASSSIIGQVPDVISNVLNINTMLRNMHYSIHNRNEPVGYEVAKKSWIPADPHYHRLGQGNKSNVKYLSVDGHNEAVYNPYTRKHVLDPKNQASYNIISVHTTLGKIVHFFPDMIPYFAYGNSPDDPTTFFERVTGYSWR